jgi:hypothetical protein
MRSIATAIAAVALIAFAGAAQAQHQGWTFEFVGFSSGTVLPSVGAMAMTDECNATYGAARMCTSEEFLNSVFDQVAPAGPAWIRPAFQGFDGSTAIDASGVTGTMTCIGWSSVGGVSHLAVSGSGTFSQEFCHIAARPVACCQLQETPAAPPAMAAAFPLWLAPAIAGGLLGVGVMRAGKRS